MMFVICLFSSCFFSSTKLARVVFCSFWNHLEFQPFRICVFCSCLSLLVTQCLFCSFSLWKWWFQRLTCILLPENISPLFSTSYTFCCTFFELLSFFLWGISLVMPVDTLVRLYPVKSKTTEQIIRTEVQHRKLSWSWIAMKSNTEKRLQRFLRENVVTSAGSLGTDWGKAVNS